MSQLVWLNGDFTPPQLATVSIFDHGVLYGDGVFEGLRYYSGRVLKLGSHLQRLYDGAKELELDIPYSPHQLKEAIYATIRSTKNADGYVRLTVTRGVGKLGLEPKNCARANVFIIPASITSGKNESKRLFRDEIYREGLSAIVSGVRRNLSSALPPRIKSINYLNNIRAKLDANAKGADEAIMLNNDGYVAEGTGDNVLIVKSVDRAPTVITPPPSAGILEGITMNVILGLAADMGIKTVRRDITPRELVTADEVFLTGTAAEVVPVVRVDGSPIGRGKPGCLTRELSRAFQKLACEHTPED